MHRVAPVLFLWQGAGIGNYSARENTYLPAVAQSDTAAECCIAAPLREQKGMGDGSICSFVSCCYSMYVGVVRFVTLTALSTIYLVNSAVDVSVSAGVEKLLSLLKVQQCTAQPTEKQMFSFVSSVSNLREIGLHFPSKTREEVLLACESAIQDSESVDDLAFRIFTIPFCFRIHAIWSIKNVTNYLEQSHRDRPCQPASLAVRHGKHRLSSDASEPAGLFTAGLGVPRHNAKGTAGT